MFLPEFPIKELPLKTGYIFLDIISKGAYGKVYKVQKQESGDIFALKVVGKATIVAENAVMQAKQEVKYYSLIIIKLENKTNIALTKTFINLIQYLSNLDVLHLGSDTENGWTSSFHSKFYS